MSNASDKIIENLSNVGPTLSASVGTFIHAFEH